MAPHLTFINRERAVISALLDRCQDTGAAAGTSKLPASAKSTPDRDIGAMRGRAANTATTSLKFCPPNLWSGRMSAPSAQILVSSSS